MISYSMRLIKGCQADLRTLYITEENTMEREYVNVEQKVLNPPSGILMLAILILASIFSLVGFVIGLAAGSFGLILICILLWIILPFMFAGLRSVRPNEALVLTLFGKYYGTIMKPGYFFVNPFARYNNPAYEAQAAAEVAEKAEMLTD